MHTPSVTKYAALKMREPETCISIVKTQKQNIGQINVSSIVVCIFP